MSNSLPERPKVDRVGHVLKLIADHEARGRPKLSASAKFLAVILARKLAMTPAGHWICWRGRKSLAKLTGFSERTINTARRELLQAGFFRHLLGASTVETISGTYSLKRGSMLLELIGDVEAFLVAREATRARLERERIVANQPIKIGLQKRLVDFGGDLTPEAYQRELAKQTRRRRRLVKTVAVS